MKAFAAGLAGARGRRSPRRAGRRVDVAMSDNATHRRTMVDLAQPQVVESVLIADIFEPPKSFLANLGGAVGLIGLVFAWKDANRAGGLPPKVLVALTIDHVYFLKIERSLSSWTVRYVVREWETRSFPLTTSTANPAAITIEFDGLQVRLTSAAGSGAVARELVGILSRSRPSR